MTDLLQNHYSQVKNPNPVFTPREGKKTLPFCRKLMAKAEGFTSRFDFSIHVAFLRSLGKRHRMPPLLRRRAIDALLQAMCFHYDPLANRVQRSITNMASQQLTREYATGRFRGDKEALKREVERRVQERMLLSRGNNYTRLATVPI
ncbi:plasmid replication initiator RepA [Klebsiella pneumoniae]|uniref:plasmid replication initiator RepA n=1 Tax=Klebsiella pneumoniae TaxID=573 RepID=UPI0015EADBD8|nr:plasmid replication initiator RepA [Klebsiella pneumoniae]QLU48766.1 hypothetical protein HV247_26655 [Klebsiella pneumoniae]